MIELGPFLRVVLRCNRLGSRLCRGQIELILIINNQYLHRQLLAWIKLVVLGFSVKRMTIELHSQRKNNRNFTYIKAFFIFRLEPKNYKNDHLIDSFIYGAYILQWPLTNLFTMNQTDFFFEKKEYYNAIYFIYINGQEQHIQAHTLTLKI